MTFKETFCPSPWFHTRISHGGRYAYCRWAVKQDSQNSPNIKEKDPVTWFKIDMSRIRRAMLEGQSVAGCQECHQMEQHGKVSGRQKQLLKIGVTVDDFEKTMLSSPWIEALKTTGINNGEINLMPQDWQIDLGNYCNSACLFCAPESSSRLATEYQKLALIKHTPPGAWCDDPALLARFVDMLAQSPRLVYLHFIGGETLITPAFKTILKCLIDHDIAKQTTVGFTTNLTVWDQHTVDLLGHFHAVNLGMSVECLHPANDYVRYGSDLATVRSLLDRWIALARQQQWFQQLRITPTILSIWHLDTIYQFAAEQGIAVESCNFINEPAFMRPSVLPKEFRQRVISKLQIWIDQQAMADGARVINIRHPDLVHEQIVQDAKSYVRYLENQPDESWRLRDLVDYLKIMENSRHNRVLDYLPDYEELFRSVGY